MERKFESWVLRSDDELHGSKVAMKCVGCVKLPGYVDFFLLAIFSKCITLELS